MSGSGFHVHGPHDHELEHAAEAAAHDQFASRIAVTTALLAILAAMCSYLAGATQASAGLYKNNAAIKKTEAANQWSYFQSKSTKQNVAELGVLIVPADKAAQLQADITRYEREKNEIQGAAKQLEKESAAWDVKSEEQIHLHHRWAQATTALQVAIAMAAIALITRRRWMQGLVYAFAGVGLLIGVLALLHI